MNSSKEQEIPVYGTVLESQQGAKFKVQLENDAETIIFAYACGKMRRKHIRIIAGDRVKVMMTRYSQSQGRIVLRENPTNTKPVFTNNNPKPPYKK